MLNLLIKLSLLLNIVVLVPLCIGFLQNASWIHDVYGEPSPALAILFSIYFSLLVASAVLLFIDQPKLVFMLLAIQILYKLVTPMVVGSIQHPVIVSNILIAALHIVTVAWIFYSGELGFSIKSK